MYRILIIEDDDKIAAILKRNLEKYNYEVIRGEKFDQVKQEVIEHEPHLVLLDINLPHFDGYYWCRQIRTVSNVPIIFVSARTSNMEQVMAIENGGDDFITKPFDLDVVQAKIKGTLRRVYGEYAPAQAAEQESDEDKLQLHYKGLQLDRGRNVLSWKDHRTELTKNESLLLQRLLSTPGIIVSREELLELLWDDVQFVDDNTLSVNVGRVRKKLEELGITNAVDTIRGQGYRFVQEWEGTQS
ncbi:response regulator transcription factor [Paenibacillus guangzhouensis]|uniref:response regulator transcription factor n=1 Tax=Paenibacillus guangzhouensis TaxID=1473112 RepID=UPI00126773CF|nr:response regulator transcription factor [Paenibacillus guangzhouensis]